MRTMGGEIEGGRIYCTDQNEAGMRREEGTNRGGKAEKNLIYEVGKTHLKDRSPFSKDSFTQCDMS